MEVIHTENRKARKEHRCDFCGGKILKGEDYEIQTNKQDDYLYTWKSHLKCMWLSSELKMHNYDDGYGVDSETFVECVCDYIFENSTEEEREGLVFVAEAAVDKAIEILDKKK